MDTTLAPHVTTLIAIISAGFGLLVTIGLIALKGLRDELKEQRFATVAAASSVKTALESQLEREAAKWERHAQEHRDFRALMLDLSTRLSRLEGEHRQLACKSATDREDD